MLALYLATLGFGATMILVSLVLGGAGDKDLHASDHGGEHGGEHDSGDAWWLPLLSLRFWTFGTGAFGLAGTILTLLAVPWALALAVSVALALGAGLGAARFFAALRSDQVSGETDLARLVGEEARVVVPVRPGGQGKIAISTMSGRIEVLARTQDPDELEVGATVLVAGVDRDGVADVSRMNPDLGGRERALKSAAAAVRTGQGRSVGS